MAGFLSSKKCFFFRVTVHRRNRVSVVSCRRHLPQESSRIAQTGEQHLELPNATKIRRFGYSQVLVQCARSMENMVFLHGKLVFLNGKLVSRGCSKMELFS